MSDSLAFERSNTSHKYGSRMSQEIQNQVECYDS